MRIRRRWLIVLPPVLATAVIELLSDSIGDEVMPFPLDTIVVVAVVFVLTIFGTFVAFRAIDRLGETLQRRNAELETRNAAARALHHVSVAVAAMADLDEILDAIVDSARRLLGTDLALLVLIRPDGEPRLRAASGPPDAFRPQGDLPGDDVARFVQPGRLGVRLSAPLQRGGQTGGQLAVGGRTSRSFSVNDVEMLSSLANQAAIAIENARLQGELRQRDVTVERERIAREMHDGLAQVLGYVNTKSQAVEELLAAGKTDEARSQMAELAGVARSIYVDVREAILGLSSPIVPERGLVGALEGYVPLFAEQAKLVVHLDAAPEAATVDLEPPAQAQVFRIVQEALTNVRKHASARRVWVRMAVDGDELVVDVEDDGRGFDSSTKALGGWPHFGLKAMRERAAAVGARIEWLPRSSGGTRLVLRVPLASVMGGVEISRTTAEVAPASEIAASESPMAIGDGDGSEARVAAAGRARATETRARP